MLKQYDLIFTYKQIKLWHLSSNSLDGDGEQWGVTFTAGTTLQQSVKHSAYSRCLQGKCQEESTEVADPLTTISIGGYFRNLVLEEV